MSRLEIDNVDWNNFRIAKSGRAIKLLYNKEPVQFCTAALYTPFGVRSQVKEWSAFTEYHLDCSLDQATSEAASAFRNFLSQLDEKIKELVVENKDMFAEDDCIYTPMLKENGSYPKLLKLNLQRDRNGNFQSFVFDTNKDKIKISDSNIEELLSKGKVFKCIIECSKLWCFKGKIGSIWTINQLKFIEKRVIGGSSGEHAAMQSDGYNNLMIQDD